MKRLGFFQRLRLAQRLLAAAYLVSLGGLYFSLSSLEAAENRSRALAAYAEKVHVAARSCRHLVRLLRSRKNLAELDSARRDASKLIARSQLTAGAEIPATESAELARLSRFLHLSGRLIDMIERLQKEGRAREAAAIYNGRLKPLLERYVAAEAAQRLRAEEERRLETRSRSLLWTRVSAGFLAAVSALTFLIAALWTRRLAAYAERNVAAVQRTLTALRSGDYQVKIDPERADEFGALSTSLKSLAARLGQAQRRQASFSRVADESSRALNDIVFAVTEFAAVARCKSDFDAEDERRLKFIIERAGRCNHLLGRLSELSAGQMILSEGTPEILAMIREIEGAAARRQRDPRFRGV